MAGNAVIFHHPDGGDTNHQDNMERYAAGDDFLRGFVSHAGVDEFFAYTLNADHFADFARQVRNIAGRTHSSRRLDHTSIGQPDVPGTLSLPGHELAPFAWRRRTMGDAAYSLCGFNHTIASLQSMNALGNLLTVPMHPWDALVCPSHASKIAMRHVIDGYAAYLEERLGVRPPFELQMPVIPPGVDCAAYAHSAAASEDRALLRRGLGIEEQDIVLLYVGQLSYQAKAHPLPFYIAAEAAARRTGRRVHMIQAGWFDTATTEREFRDSARTLCPSVNAIFLDGRDQDVRRRIWRAADIFVSLSDNIQESFGLTPVEAMAAGLPVVVSDWNGYRETVHNGLHGFTIPTWMPAGGEGRDVAFAPELGVSGVDVDATYDRYCGVVSQSTVVDSGACIDALSVLCADVDKRHVMGEAGRKHANEHYDWSVVIKAYQALWDELDSRRARAAKEPRHMRLSQDIPLSGDPFDIFAAYPTSNITDATELRLVDAVDYHLVDSRLTMHMNNFGAKHLLHRDDMVRVVNILKERGSVHVRDIATALGEATHSRIVLSLGWLAKMNLVHLSGGVTTIFDPDHPAREGWVASEGRQGETDGEALDLLEQRNPQGGFFAASRNDHILGDLLELSVSELNDRARAARANGDTILAAACLHRAHMMMPEDPEILVQKGELLASGGRHDPAIACFRHVIQTHPGHLDAHKSLGKTLSMRGDEAESIHSFRRAVRVAPEDGEARLLLGVALRQAGAVNEAMQCLRIATEIDPEHADAGYHLGLVCRALNRPEEARKAFGRVLSMEPTNRFAQAAIMSMDAELLGRAVSERHDGRKISLHMTCQADYFALKPVFEILCADHWPLFSADLTEIAEFRPDAVLTTSSRLSEVRDFLPECTVVQIPDKAFRSIDNIHNGHAADAVCTASEEEQRAYAATGMPHERVWLTGLPLMDPVFGGVLRRQREESAGKGKTGLKRLLYMPDWRQGVSAERVVKGRLIELCQKAEGHFDVTILPHPKTQVHQKGWIEHWTDMAASCPNLSVCDHPGIDFLTIMASADLLIADFSLMALTFLAFDAPLLLVPPREDVLPQDRLRQDHVSLLENAAMCLTGNDDIVASALSSLNQRKVHDEERARARAVIFGATADGRAAIRLVSSLRRYLDS